MLKQAFSSLKSAVRPEGRTSATVPDGTRVYAIGDIHGRADLLDQLHQKIREDAQRSDAHRRVIVYLGDYVDRGLDSKGVIDQLLADQMPGFEKVFLKGNHEDAFLKFLAEPEFGRKWKYYGGLETLMSYGVKALPLKDEPEAFVAARDELAKDFPSAHMDFLGGLGHWHEEGDFFFAHAGVRPGRSLTEQANEDLMWIRDEFLTSDEDFGKVVVHGHTPADQPVERSNRIGIDTGGYITGILTCVVLDGAERRFIQTGV